MARLRREPRVAVLGGFAEFVEPTALILGHGRPENLVDRQGRRLSYGLFKRKAHEERGVAFKCAG